MLRQKMFIAYSYAVKAGISGCLHALLCLHSGCCWKVVHEKMGKKSEKRIRDIGMALGNKRGNVINFFTVYIPRYKQCAGHQQGHLWPLIAIPGSPFKIIQGSSIACTAQGTVKILCPGLDVKLNAPS